VVHPLESVVTAKTMHFSLYQVLASQAGASAGLPASTADSSFVLREVYVFPNPARGGAKPVFHVEVGVADRVRIRVFDAAGRPVYEASLTDPPRVIDDGTGPEYAYEHVWEGRIASGLYFYVIEAEKAGSAPIRKSGKFVVVR
jgi:hypothetical protein